MTGLRCVLRRGLITAVAPRRLDTVGVRGSIPRVPTTRAAPSTIDGAAAKQVANTRAAAHASGARASRAAGRSARPPQPGSASLSGCDVHSGERDARAQACDAAQPARGMADAARVTGHRNGPRRAMAITKLKPLRG